VLQACFRCRPNQALIVKKQSLNIGGLRSLNELGWGLQLHCGLQRLHHAFRNPHSDRRLDLHGDSFSGCSTWVSQTGVCSLVLLAGRGVVGTSLGGQNECGKLHHQVLRLALRHSILNRPQTTLKARYNNKLGEAKCMLMGCPFMKRMFPIPTQ
jgi:hypothetical protein